MVHPVAGLYTTRWSGMVVVVVCLLTLVGGCEGRVEPGEAVGADGAEEVGVWCDCVLESWVVAGSGRHLVLLVDCPDGFDDLDGAVEFTSEVLRRDYVERRGAGGALLPGRVARMTRGVRLRPVVADPAERVEGSWRVPVAQARLLQADRVWESPYVLVGTNSNSAMAAVFRAAGLELPERVARGGGVFGEFPGIDLGLGRVVELVPVETVD